jgi:hypothetical protein
MQAGVALKTMMIDRMSDMHLVEDQDIQCLEDFPPLRGVAKAMVYA